MQNQMLNIFISYRRTDSQFVDRLEVDLRVRGYQTWLDRIDLARQGGHSWKEELRKEIERAHVILLVVSPKAIESPYVRWEYIYALKLNKPLIPLLYLPCPDGIPE